MVRYFLVLLFTLFQDNYVRLGTITGTLIGFWSPSILQGDPSSNVLTFAFIGWGLGTYLANYLSWKKQNRKKRKFEVFQGKK